MISLLKAESKEELNQIFSDIEKSDGNDVKDWIDYYQITHILATMNSLASLMDVEIWNRYGNNINTAEAAHSLVNRTGKQLKLLSAILRGQKLDERHLKIIEIQDFSAVPYTKQDKSQVKRQLKYGQSKIQPIDENNYEFKSDNSRSFRA
ncbi:20658_t:CDS:2 [Rhizophagus irregularis]|nr:20658_t:CDS:2 [Rhizophagus irregularis]